jgi:ketosteroid isomerase-like protein
MKYLFCIFLHFSFYPLLAQKDEENIQIISTLMSDQVKDWNNGDLEAFMKPYWKSDSLKFIGKTKVNYGWQTTLDHYKQGYPNKEKMGNLSFEIISIQKLSEDYYFLVGKWKIDYLDAFIGGHYSLLWQKIKGSWFIIVDHSS